MQEHAPGVHLAQPLSQKGVGPGMIIILSLSPDIGNLRLENGVPSPLLKWAEEGYAVVAVCPGALQGNQDSIASAIEALSVCENCQPKRKVGLVRYDLEAWSDVIKAANACQDIVEVVVYRNIDLYIPTSSTAKIVIESGKPLAYRYAAVNLYQLTTPFHPEFDYGIEAKEYIYYEFETHSVPQTIITIVQELYINYIPTLTGGIGRACLILFYQNHFIFNNPANTELKLISYTVDINRVVNNIFPGIPPTGCKVEIPFTAVINTKRKYQVPGAGRETAKKMRDKNAVESNQIFKHSLRTMDTSQPPVSTKLD
ncbi:hypothetical protein BDV41DRAFT_568094 [Aspergillus transmontanensis]|uniref:Uncharacterized protein n=1 Tax=Aspergillus transmontanensis TaxID=1034304 RepID=A0A5N6VJP5_9EURO|nr:hypothetical protein BDV41DRAFT_568094 [Aspergillus transmontanensis]